MSMNFENTLRSTVVEILNTDYNHEVDPGKLIFNSTSSDIEGDITIVLFPFIKALKKNPTELGDNIGSRLKERFPQILDFNILKGFLNLILSDEYYIQSLKAISSDDNFGNQPNNGQTVLVEFSSPNTNKPLHLGHIRNILLGWSSAKLLDAAGYTVIKTQIVNDRGIAICKSMLAWLKYGNSDTPTKTKTKGDHFVGNYYVLFEQKFKAEYQKWQNTDKAIELFEKSDTEDNDKFFKAFKNKYFNEYSALGKEAKELLLNWENENKETRELWKEMNAWVYHGFDETYKDLGVSFDRVYYESDTYLLGKSHIQKGLDKGIFYKKEDGSVWIDLEDVKMDHKLVLRSDGTSVYMTQDIGTADVRYNETGAEKMVYVVADEQDYHFKALFEIMRKLGAPYADGLHHLSYGMVDLPSGKMKSREGTVVDADDLIADIIEEAKESALESGDIETLSVDEQKEIFRKIGLSALKFFILKVNARKRMVFDPKESLDMKGQTGPYIQNAYVRIASILRKSDATHVYKEGHTHLHETEKALVKELMVFPKVIKEAAIGLEPSLIANYNFNLAKLYHRFYHDCRILSAPDESTKLFRIHLSKQVSKVLKRGMEFLGIEMPEKM